MRPGYIGIVIAILLLIAAIVGYSTFFTVYQTRQALVVRLGEPVRVITEPGLNVKIPFIDKRDLYRQAHPRGRIAGARSEPSEPGQFERRLRWSASRSMSTPSRVIGSPIR